MDCRPSPECSYCEPALVIGAIINFGSPERQTFSVEDISIVATPTFGGNGIDRRYSAEPAWIRRSRVTLPKIGAFLDNIRAVFLETCASTEITDSQLDARVAFFARDGVSYVRLENDELDWRDNNVNISSRTHNFIVANDTFNMRGTSAINGWGQNPNAGYSYTAFYGTRIGGPYTRDLYSGHNHETADTPEAPQGLILTSGYTSDGTVGIYLGKFAMTDATHMTLAGTTTDPGIDSANQEPITFDWTGAIAEIIDGKGAGQYRFLTHATDRASNVTIDRGWDVEPDATSTIDLVNLQGRSLWIGNDYTYTYTNQEYYTAIDVIRANNTFPVGGNVNWIGKPYSWSTYVTPWHFQVLDNQITSSANFLTFVGDTSDYDGICAMDLVYRNNVYATPGTTQMGLSTKGQVMTDSVFEKNTTGFISLGAATDPLAYRGIVLRKNNASYDTGNLTGVDLGKVQGVTYVP